MIDRIRFRSLNELLLANRFFYVSFETFQQRILSSEMRVAKDFFLEQEDYRNLHVMQNNEEYFRKFNIYINVFLGKRLIITKSDYYSKLEYEAIFNGAGIKLSREELLQLIKIANGL